MSILLQRLEHFDPAHFRHSDVGDDHPGIQRRGAGEVERVGDPLGQRAALQQLVAQFVVRRAGDAVGERAAGFFEDGRGVRPDAVAPGAIDQRAPIAACSEIIPAYSELIFSSCMEFFP